MKKLILFFTLIVSQSLFAGTGGGGIMMKFSPHYSNSAIVNHMSKQDGVVRFAHAQFVDNNWEVQNIETSATDLAASPALSKALGQSQIIKNWTTVKN